MRSTPVNHDKINANIPLLTEVIKPLPTLTDIIEAPHRFLSPPH